MPSDSLISQAPQVLSLVAPKQAWYDHALTGVLLGFFLGFVANLLKEFVQNQTKRKAMVSNLYNEIGVNYTRARIDIRDTETIKEEFQRVSSTTPQGAPSDTPRMVYHGVKNNQYYGLYFKDLNLLDELLQERVAQFYSILKGVDGRSKTIDGMFKDYYSGNPLVKAGDILSQLDKAINQHKAVEILGVEAITIIHHLYKTDSFDKEEIKKFTGIIDGYIKSVGIGNNFALRDLSDKTAIGLETAAFVLYTLKNVENVNWGEYKVLSA